MPIVALEEISKPNSIAQSVALLTEDRGIGSSNPSSAI